MASSRRGVVLGLLPLLVPYAALFGAGLVLTLLQSLDLLTPLGGSGPTLDHYRTLAHDRSLGQSLAFTLYVALISAAGSVTGGTLLALALWRMPPTARRIGIVSKIGLILPHVSVAFVVLLFFSRTGLVASLCFQLGLIDSAEGFAQLLYTGSGLGMILAYWLKGVPFALLLIGAVLFGFDTRLIQTARMLGAGRLRIFWSVVLPRIGPAVHSAFIILFLYALGAFDIPFVLGESSPAMLSIRIYDLFFQQDLAERPKVMAILTGLFVFAAVFSALYLRFAAYLESGRRKL